MKIGLVIAIEKEIEAFLSEFENLEVLSEGYFKVYRAKAGKNEVYALKSGWGHVDAAAATQFLLTTFKCSAIFNYGVTGALDPSLKVDDLFIAEKVINYNYDTSEIDPFLPHQYEGEPSPFMALDAGLLEKAKKAWPELKSAVVASGDAFVSDKKLKEELFSMGCNLVEMELGAIRRIAALNGVPVLSVKCISDTYDGDGSDFLENVRRSSKKAFVIMKKLLLEL